MRYGVRNATLNYLREGTTQITVKTFFDHLRQL